MINVFYIFSSSFNTGRPIQTCFNQQRDFFPVMPPWFPQYLIFPTASGSATTFGILVFGEWKFVLRAISNYGGTRRAFLSPSVKRERERDDLRLQWGRSSARKDSIRWQQLFIRSAEATFQGLWFSTQRVPWAQFLLPFQLDFPKSGSRLKVLLVRKMTQVKSD